MSRPGGWNEILDSAQRLVAPGALQIARRSVARLPHSGEAMELIVSALGALDRHTGVQTLNLDLDGRSVAVAIIKDATFDHDEQGVTALVRAETRKDTA